jgi:uracil-DNA glycosylase
MSKEPDASTLPEDWAQALRERHYDVDGLKTFVDGVYDSAEPGTVFPSRTDLFRAFHLTKLENVRVVILGQDPYPQPDQAHGLAFSVPKAIPVPRSLSAVYRNLEGDPLASPAFVRPAHGDLSAWAKQGVFLLNTALTVELGRAGSHKRLWTDFTDLVLRVVGEERDHVAFLLWGTHAIDRVAAVGIPEPPHLVVRSAHPTARGRTKQTRFRESRPFSCANAFLTDHQLPPVKWDLAADL